MPHWACLVVAAAAVGNNAVLDGGVGDHIAVDVLIVLESVQCNRRLRMKVSSWHYSMC